MMKASIKTNGPLFNTDRMIADYVAKVYAPGISTSVESIRASVLA
jgi:starch phosphorylase